MIDLAQELLSIAVHSRNWSYGVGVRPSAALTARAVGRQERELGADGGEMSKEDSTSVAWWKNHRRQKNINKDSVASEDVQRTAHTAEMTRIPRAAAEAGERADRLGIFLFSSRHSLITYRTADPHHNAAQ